MAKAKAKAKAKKKKALDPKEQHLSEKEIKQGLAILDEMIDTRYEYAEKILEGQSQSVKHAVEEMIEIFEAMAGPPDFRYKGVRIHAGDAQVEHRMQLKLFRWIAVRLMVACAKWDIRVADLKLPKKLCADCGVRVK